MEQFYKEHIKLSYSSYNEIQDRKTFETSLVSIIMPVYNGSSFISNTIESILNQTYKNFELLILDDFSSDNSIEIIKCFEIKGLNFIRIKRI